VLLVDDNNLNLTAAFRLMNMYGVAADMASSGEEAVRAAQKADYDIVFMDHMMPKMSGIEAAKLIRELGGKYEKLPIVALTANSARGAREIFLSSGFDDYLQKPIELDKLSEVLKEWLPAEKIEEIPDSEYGTGDNPVFPARGSFWESVEKIGFINVEAGKNRTAGVEDMYREMLELFYNKLPHECKMLEGYLKASDLSNFDILVHGMKSSLSTIGALGLSGMALRLEIAAKAGDRQVCEDNLPEFLECLRELHAQLTEIVGQSDAPPEGGEGDKVYFCKQAKIALNAAHAYDVDQSLEAVEKMLKYDYGAEKNAFLKNARTALKNFDFAEAVKLLREMLKI
jgi:CheY-like chemotaxis protein/HPt (histidine-containing phosphotransfer) domain-containing protein